MKHLQQLVGSNTIGKVNPTSSVNQEHNKPDIWVRNSDVAKIRTKVGQSTVLTQYADRRPPHVNEKTLQQKILCHIEGLLRKSLSSKQIK